MKEAQHEEEILGKAYDARLMRRLLGYLRPHRRILITAIGVITLAAIIGLAGPVLTIIAIDLFIKPAGSGPQSAVALAAVKVLDGLDWHPDRFTGISVLGAIYLGMLAFEFLLTYWQTLLVQTLGQNVMYELRQKVFEHLQRLDVQYYDRTPVGRLITRLTTDVDALNELFTAGVVAVFEDVFSLLGIVILMFVLDWRLALVAFTVLPLLIGVTLWFKLHARDSYRKVRTRIARINTLLQEHISGMATVQLFNREGASYAEFDRSNNDHRIVNIDAIFFYAVFYPAVELVSALGVALIIWYGGGQVIHGALTIGALVGFIQLSHRFYQPISDLSEKYNILQAAMASSERIFRLLDTPVQIESVKDAHKPREVRGEIEFRNVWFAYQDEDWVLRDISFRIAPGERVAMVGHTGAGKTTITNLLMRFYEVQRGEILLDGRNIRDWDLPALRGSFAIVLQDVFLFSGDIASNIRLGHEEWPLAVVEAAASEVHADGFIQRLPGGYQAEVMERGATLSSGQKQLIAFARALAFDPKVLILDEATASIDTQTEILIQDALERLQRNRTSLVIAHRLSTIQHADRILVLHKGRLRESGTHDDLLKLRGLYYRLYQLQYRDQAAPVAAD
ncbi:MAG: ABC transporter ATP-binding protein [Acidobacteria bacterium]|nr:ABC transporter ATP-binding protein [Acidobacteriota bacterium]